MTGQEMAEAATHELREALIALADLHRKSKTMQDRANIALAKIETFVALSKPEGA